LLLNKKASAEIAWHCKHYKGRGLMKFYKNMGELAKEMGIDVSAVKETFENYNEVADKQAKDPEGGPYEAYGGGKSWDKYGKKFYHNGPMSVDDEFHVAIVTPVVHYCMGGIVVDGEAAVLKKDGVIPGLYGAGEVNGGIHGENRLGGSSLLDCVVFGRVAGRTASKYLLESKLGIQAKM
jgi:succinate dehydrogenase/fumarate reductase flavoprotein subunit